jgi:transposase
MWHHFNDEAMVPQDHPLRGLLPLVNHVLERLSPAFAALYAENGRASIPPERLLRALLLQCFYGIRSERMLIEQLHYNFLFRWFVGLGPDEPVWHSTTFSKNRERFIDGDIARKFFDEIVALAQARGLMSDEHFSVDGTLIEAWASHKSFKRKDGSDDDDSSTDFRGSKRSNETHQSTTDPDARLARKSKAHPSILAYGGHFLMENRHGLVRDLRLTRATGRSEREAAVEMVKAIPGNERITVGADKGYDTSDFVEELRSYSVTPHVASNQGRRGGSAVDGRTTRHEGYDISQHKRKGIEKIFGWHKAFAGLRKTKHRGLHRVRWCFTLFSSAYNLMRIGNLMEATT